MQNRLDPYLSGDRKVAPIGKNVRKRRRSDYYLLVAGPLRCTNKMVREKWMEDKRTYETRGGCGCKCLSQGEGQAATT